MIASVSGVGQSKDRQKKSCRNLSYNVVIAAPLGRKKTPPRPIVLIPVLLSECHLSAAPSVQNCLGLRKEYRETRKQLNIKYLHCI